MVVDLSSCKLVIFIDWGGIFIDVYVIVFGKLDIVFKFLFVDFVNYKDVFIEGICCVFEFVIGLVILCGIFFWFDDIECLCMGITIVINVFLECKGMKFVFFIMIGFKDLFKIGN